MNISCDSCGKKYKVADEKVAGRTFKIRCRQCGAQIVVRGEAGASSAPAAAQPASDAIWHVVVNGDQQGPYSAEQLTQMIGWQQIGWDTFVWREGFDDWKPAQDVAELVQAATAAAAPAGAATSSAGADPFDDGDGATMVRSSLSDIMPQSAAAAPNKAADFFGSVEPKAPDVVVSKASPRASVRAPQASSGVGAASAAMAGAGQSHNTPSAQPMTGARNENSVLFSLANLQALATGSSGGPSAPLKSTPAPSRPGMAAGEGSGLIDIRALASATSASPSTGLGGGKRVDDLLSIGSPSASLGVGLGSPVIMPDRGERSGNRSMMMMMAAFGFGILALGAVAIYFAFIRTPEAPVAANAVPVVVPAGAVPAPPSVASPPAAAGAPAAAVPPPPAAVVPPPAANSESRSESRPSSGGSRRSSGASSGGSSAPATAPATPPSTGGGSRSSGGGGDLGSLLDQALGGGGGGGRRPAAEPAAPARGGPETPSSSDVRSALSGVQGAVSSCGNGQHGRATVNVTFAGTTGRVSSATVEGQFASTPIGSCIARAVRGARVSPFSRASFSVRYPYSI